MSLSLPKVVITGGCGNLGNKLTKHLIATEKFVPHLLEHPDFFDKKRVPRGAKVTLCDIGASPGLWEDTLDGAAAVIHLSAVNPYPTAKWEESRKSMDQTFNLFLAAATHRVPRVIFASSNHVMGKHRTTGGALFDGTNAITPETELQVGTVWDALDKTQEPVHATL